MKYNFQNIQGLNKQDYINSTQKLKIERELESAYQKIIELVKENKELKIEAEQIANIRNNEESIDYNHKIVAILAHDLRSPFNSIIGFLEMIKADQEMDNSKRNHYIDLILSVGNNALEMLDMLLYWVVNENNSFKPIIVNLHNEIEESLLLIRPIAQDKKITIENLVPSNLFIKADVNILRTVIRNLSSNSVKFTNTEGKITIFSNCTLNQVEISVIDNGVGFDSEYLDSLLKNKSYESNESINDRWKGLGLLLCRDFISIHGGVMTIHSDSQTGTKVKFTLPQYK